MKSRSKRTERAFAVLDRPDGSLAYGTIRPTAAEAWSIWKRWNPDVDTGQLVKIQLTITPCKEN